MLCYKVTLCNLARPSNQRAVDLRPNPASSIPLNQAKTNT